MSETQNTQNEIILRDKITDIIVAFEGYFARPNELQVEARFNNINSACLYARQESVAGYARVIIIDGRIFRRYDNGTAM